MLKHPHYTTAHKNEAFGSSRVGETSIPAVFLLKRSFNQCKWCLRPHVTQKVSACKPCALRCKIAGKEFLLGLSEKMAEAAQSCRQWHIPCENGCEPQRKEKRAHLARLTSPTTLENEVKLTGAIGSAPFGRGPSPPMLKDTLSVP